MGAEANRREMRAGLPITTANGMISMACLLLMIFYTIHQFRTRGYRIEKDIRRASMAVFYSSFILAFVQVLLWAGIITDVDDCFWIVKFNVITLSMAKMALYYLYTVRLDYTFRGTDWEIAPIILFFIRIAIVLVFGIISVIMVVNIKPGKTGTFDWGVYCNIVLGDAILWIYGSVDFLITSYLLYLFSSRLFKVSQKVGSTLAKKDNALYHLVRLITALTLVSIVSSWVIACGYGIYKPIAWFTSIDFLFNALCVFLMFEFMHLVDRIRYAGFLCCLCQIFWPKQAKQEYNDFLESIEAQIQAKNELEAKKRNENNVDDNGNPLDLKVDINNKNNENKNKAKVDTNTGTPRQHPIRHKSTTSGTSGTSGSKASLKLQSRNTDEIANVKKDSNKNNNKTKNTVQFLDAENMKGLGKNMNNDNNNNNMDENGSEIKYDENEDDDNENDNEREKTQLTSTQMTRTEDLDFQTLNTDANPEHSTPAEWTLASDVLANDENGHELQAELVAGDAEAQQQAQANQYAMEIMQLHANIDRF